MRDSQEVKVLVRQPYAAFGCVGLFGEANSRYQFLLFLFSLFCVKGNGILCGMVFFKSGCGGEEESFFFFWSDLFGTRGKKYYIIIVGGTGNFVLCKE